MPNPFAVVASEMSRPGPHRARMMSFSGGQMSRYTEDWNPFIQSPKQEIAHYLLTLRARARQLERDNSYAAGFLTELAGNVIGADGIMLQAKIKRRDGTLDLATNFAIESAFREWGMPEHASADGYESWTDLQRMLMRTMARDGEFFLQKLPFIEDNPFRFAVRIIDADLVDETYNRAPATGVNEIRLGIEVNQWGRPLAYHVWSAYSGDSTGPRVRQRIPADQIIHRFIRYRANQVRGVTWFAPILTNLHFLDGYEFAELVAARASAAKMGFIKNTSEDAIKAFGWDDSNIDQRVPMEVAPGSIPELLPGQEFQEFNPTHPSTAFKDFTKAVLRGAARGVNMAYTTMTGDLEAVNYSSIRAGLLSERDFYRMLQGWFAVHVSRPTYRAWLPMAMLTGSVVVATRNPADYYAVQWRGRGWKWVDPRNDLEAAALAISLGTTSRQRLCAEQGVDFEEVMAEQKYEQEFAKTMGITLGADLATQESKVTVTDPNAAGGDGSEPTDTSNAGDANDESSGDPPNARALALTISQRRGVA